MLENKPIELWLPTELADDPVNIASYELMIETGVYVHHLIARGQNQCLRVTYPIKVFWPWTKTNHFSDDESCTVNSIKYNVRIIEINDTLPYAETN